MYGDNLQFWLSQLLGVGGTRQRIEKQINILRCSAQPPPHRILSPKMSPGRRFRSPTSKTPLTHLSISNAFPRGTLEYTMNSNHSSHILPFHPPLRFLNIARAILLELKPTPVASLLQRIQWLPSLGKSWVFCGIYMNLRRQELIISLTIHCFLPTVCQSHWPPAGGHTQIHDHLRAFAATFPQPIHPCVSNLTSSGHQPMSTAV